VGAQCCLYGFLVVELLDLGFECEDVLFGLFAELVEFVYELFTFLYVLLLFGYLFVLILVVEFCEG
jgi:hypothetical protein